MDAEILDIMYFIVGKKKEQSLISFEAKGVITNKFWLSFVKQTQTK